MHGEMRGEESWGPHEEDQLAERLDRAVSAIERICRPLIEEPKPAGPRLGRRPRSQARSVRN